MPSKLKNPIGTYKPARRASFGDFAKKVVVVGAGFAGLAAVEALAAADVDVTLIDRHNFATFQPLLYQVATAGLNPGDVSFPIRSLLRKFPKVHFRQGELSSIDGEGKRIRLMDGSELVYDFLILAFGAAPNYFGVPGADGNSDAIYSLDDAIDVRNKIFHQFERAAAIGNGQSSLTFVVVGGGATGVEMAGATAELCEKALAMDYTTITPSEVKVILIEQRDKVLEAFDDKLSGYALRELRERGVEVLLGEIVEEIKPTCVSLKSGRVIDFGIIIWAAGVKAPELANDLGLPQGRAGRLSVTPDLRAVGRTDIFVVGDLADISTETYFVPQLAQPALQAGKHAANQILRIIDGKTTESFVYHDRGTMATIGRHAAVAELNGGIKLTGGAAWLAWLVLHLVTLLGVRNKLSVLLNWAWHYVSWGKGPRVILGG